MPIDGFTVCAQIINFLILLWLLKRFLYRPILSAVENREQLIKKQLESAEETKRLAQLEKENYEKQNADFSRKRSDLLKSIDEECRLERSRLLHETREEYTKLKEEQKKLLKREQDELAQNISLVAQREIFTVIRKTLSDLASAKLEEMIVLKFLKNLEALNNEGKDVFRKSESLFIRSAFELSQEQKELVEKKLSELFSPTLLFKYTIAPERVCGIELIGDDHKIGWTISEYLDSMQSSIAQTWDLQ